MFKITISVTKFENEDRWSADGLLTVLEPTPMDRHFVVTGRSRLEALDEAVRFAKLSMREETK